MSHEQRNNNTNSIRYSSSGLVFLSLSDLAWKPFFVPTIFDRLRSSQLTQFAHAKKKAAEILILWLKIDEKFEFHSIHSVRQCARRCCLPRLCRSPVVSWVAAGLMRLTVWSHLLSLSDCEAGGRLSLANLHFHVCSLISPIVSPVKTNHKRLSSGVANQTIRATYHMFTSLKVT